MCGPSVSVPSACVHLLGMVIGCDTMFYWVHRLLHDNKWLYRTVHKQHHEFKGTTVWASEYFGVIDMVLNILPGVLHHSHNVGCYGDWFGFWDWLCGTDVPFNKYLKKIGVGTRTSSYTKVVD